MRFCGISGGILFVFADFFGQFYPKYCVYVWVEFKTQFVSVWCVDRVEKQKQSRKRNLQFQKLSPSFVRLIDATKSTFVTKYDRYLIYFSWQAGDKYGTWTALKILLTSAFGDLKDMTGSIKDHYREWCPLGHRCCIHSTYLRLFAPRDEGVKEESLILRSIF